MSVSEHYNYKGGEGRLDEMLHAQCACISTTGRTLLNFNVMG